MWTRLLIAAATALAICGAGWLTFDSGRKSGRNEVQTAWGAEKAAIAQAVATELERTRQVEADLRERVGKLTKEHRRELASLDTTYRNLVDSLRNRPERPGGADVPGGADTGAGSAGGCTGAQLYREDAAVALGIARDADQLRLALRACQAAYDQVRIHAKPNAR